MEKKYITFVHSKQYSSKMNIQDSTVGCKNKIPDFIWYFKFVFENMNF